MFEIPLRCFRTEPKSTRRFSVSTSRNQRSVSLGSDEHVLTSIRHEKTLYLKVRLFFSRGLCFSTLKDGVGYSRTVKALLLSFSGPGVFPLGSSLLSVFGCSKSCLQNKAISNGQSQVDTEVFKARSRIWSHF